MAEGNWGTQGGPHHWDAVFENDDSPAWARKPGSPSDRQPSDNPPPRGRPAPDQLPPGQPGQPAPDPIAALAEDVQRTGEGLTQLATQLSAFEQRQQEEQERLLRTIEARLDPQVLDEKLGSVLQKLADQDAHGDDRQGELAELRQQVEQLIAELRPALGRISDQMLEQERAQEERVSRLAATVQAKALADLPPPLKRLPDVVAALAHQLAEHQQGQKSREAKLADAVSALRQEVAKAAEAAGRRQPLPNQLLRLPVAVAELGERQKSDQSELAEVLRGLRQEIDRYGQSTLALSEALAGLSRQVEDGQEQQQRRAASLSAAVDGLKPIGDLPAALTGFAERQVRALAALEAAVKGLDADAKQLAVAANRPVQLPEPVLSLPDAVTALAVHAAEQRQRQDEQGAGLAALTEAVRRLHDEVGNVFQAVDTAPVVPEAVIDIHAAVSGLAAQLGEQRQGLRKLVEHLIQQEAQQDRMVEYLAGFRNGMLRLAEALERKESSTTTGIEAATERMARDLGDLRRELAAINERLAHLAADGGTRPRATRASRAGSVGKEERTPQAS